MLVERGSHAGGNSIARREDPLPPIPGETRISIFLGTHSVVRVVHNTSPNPERSRKRAPGDAPALERRGTALRPSR